MTFAEVSGVGHLTSCSYYMGHVTSNGVGIFIVFIWGVVCFRCFCFSYHAQEHSLKTYFKMLSNVYVIFCRSIALQLCNVLYYCLASPFCRSRSNKYVRKKKKKNRMFSKNTWNWNDHINTNEVANVQIITFTARRLFVWCFSVTILQKLSNNYVRRNWLNVFQHHTRLKRSYY